MKIYYAFSPFDSLFEKGVKEKREIDSNFLYFLNFYVAI